jgi:hypothetical protein
MEDGSPYVALALMANPTIEGPRNAPPPPADTHGGIDPNKLCSAEPAADYGEHDCIYADEYAAPEKD